MSWAKIFVSGIIEINKLSATTRSNKWKYAKKIKFITSPNETNLLWIPWWYLFDFADIHHKNHQSRKRIMRTIPKWLNNRSFAVYKTAFIRSLQSVLGKSWSKEEFYTRASGISFLVEHDVLSWPSLRWMQTTHLTFLTSMRLLSQI